MPIKTLHELDYAEDQLRIAMMRGYDSIEESIRQVLVNTVSDGDVPENIRLASGRLLNMRLINGDS